VDVKDHDSNGASVGIIPLSNEDEPRTVQIARPGEVDTVTGDWAMELRFAQGFGDSNPARLESVMAAFIRFFPKRQKRDKHNAFHADR
jgi:hypothetical protein